MGVLHHGKVVEVTADGVMVTVPLLATDDSQFGPCSVFGPEVHVGDSVLVGQIENNAEDLVVIGGVADGTLEFVDSATIDFTKTVTGPDTEITAIVKPNSIPVGDLSDVAIGTPVAGEVLRYNGTTWVNTNLGADDLSDVTLSGLATGQFLRYNGTVWVNVAVLDLIAAATSTDQLTIQVTGESQKRLIVNGDGKIEWGSGSATPLDTNLYRSAANVLATDDSFSLPTESQQINIGSSGSTASVAVKRTNTGDDVLSTRVGSDTNSRCVLNAGGLIEWGSGSASVDTNLYRDSASVLKTDDTFNAAADVQCNGVTLPRGLHAWGQRTGGAKTGITSESGALRLNATLLANRAYRIASQGGLSSSANEAAQVIARLRVDTSGADASTSSTVFSTWSGTTMAGSGGGSYVCEFMYVVGGSNVSMSVLLTAARSVGTGTLTISGSTTGPEIWIYDMGPAMSETGTDI